LNIYLCERLFEQVLLIEKSAAGKVRKKNCSRKSAARKMQHKKVLQEKCGRKIAVGKVR
jgi:hypothetical protein